MRHHLDDDVARAYANLSWTALDQGELEYAERTLAEGLAFTADRDLLAMDLYLKATRARAWLGRGKWAEAVEDAEAANLSSAITLVGVSCPTVTNMVKRSGTRGCCGAILTMKYD